jgi:NAD(P)-dependent dehydrogenase (short-subunit alcohol dehydrogenase family)
MKTILITGANSGIGRALAFLMAQHQHRLILLTRKANEVEALTNEIKTGTNNENIKVLACDLSSQGEIEKCCDDLKQNYPSLDILINNAAVYTETRMETAAKIEVNLAVNVLAPFLLTQNLLPLLAKGNHPAVYNISSIGEKYAKADFDDVISIKNYAGNAVYNKSKLLLTLLTYKCSERYASTNVTFNCIHPGATMTNLVTDQDVAKMPMFLRVIFNLVKRFRQKPAQAAQAIYAILTSPQTARVTGQFFVNGRPALSSAQSRDRALMDKTWDLCLALTSPKGP